jgi:hypothetical protein
MRPLVLIGAGGASGALLGIAVTAPEGFAPALVGGAVGFVVGAALATIVLGSVVGLAIFWFLLGIIPGVLYLLFSRGSQTVALGIFPTADGTDFEIVVHPQGDGGRRRAIRFFNSLHELR